MGVAVSLRVVDCEGYQRSRRARMDIVDGVVAGRLLPLGLGNAGDRSRQGRVEAFAMRGLRRNGAARPIDDGVCPGPPVERAASPRKPEPPVSADPALRSTQRQPRLGSDAPERNILFQMGTQFPVPIKGASTARLGELCKGGPRSLSE